MPFAVWLASQRHRNDTVGYLARIADTDRYFPETNSLRLLLEHCCDPGRLGKPYRALDYPRNVMKRAHRQWRYARRAKTVRAAKDTGTTRVQVDA